jgi:hypothetical protein
MRAGEYFSISFRVIRAMMAESTTGSKEASKDEKAAAKPSAGIPKAEFVVGLATSTMLRMYTAGVFF